MIVRRQYRSREATMTVWGRSRYAYKQTKLEPKSSVLCSRHSEIWLSRPRKPIERTSFGPPRRRKRSRSWTRPKPTSCAVENSGGRPGRPLAGRGGRPRSCVPHRSTNANHRRPIGHNPATTCEDGSTAVSHCSRFRLLQACYVPVGATTLLAWPTCSRPLRSGPREHRTSSRCQSRSSKPLSTVSPGYATGRAPHGRRARLWEVRARSSEAWRLGLSAGGRDRRSAIAP